VVLTEILSVDKAGRLVLPGMRVEFEILAICVEDCDHLIVSKIIGGLSARCFHGHHVLQRCLDGFHYVFEWVSVLS